MKKTQTQPPKPQTPDKQKAKLVHFRTHGVEERETLYSTKGNVFYISPCFILQTVVALKIRVLVYLEKGTK